MTSFDKLYKFIRICVGDQKPAFDVSGNPVYRFCEDDIDTAIEFVIQEHFPSYSVATPEGSEIEAIEPDITGNDKLLLIYRVAVELLAPIDAVSVRTPMASFIRKGEGQQRQIERLEEKIIRLEGGGQMAVYTDSDITAMLEHSSRLSDELN